MADNLIKNFEEISKSDVQIAGGKGASLGEMIQAGIPVPQGFVILANAFDRFLEETDLNVEIDAVLDTVNIKEVHTVENASEKIKAMILSKEIPEDIRTEILKNYKKMDCKFVAVRSSATSEDSASAAWAGQLESYLNTTKEMLLENVKKCWASLFTPRAIFYRFEKKLNKDKISVAVVVQKMINSEESGIAFSVHPVTQDKNQIIIEAGFGLGEAIVSGSITPDSYVIDKQGFKILDINVNEQKKALYKKIKGGNQWKKLGKKGKRQVLAEKEIIELSKLIVKIENHYTFPVDIEWVKEKGEFYIVQSRPITTLNNNKIISKNDTHWVLVENIPDSDIFFFQISFSSFVEDKSYEFMENLQKMMAVFNGFHMDFYMDEKDASAWSESILNNLLQKSGLAVDIHKNIIKFSERLKDYGKKLKSLDLSLYTNKQLWSLYKEHDEIHTKLYTYGWYPVQVDILFNNFTEKLKSYLFEVCKNKEEAEHFFIILTTPSDKTIIAKEREELFNIYTKHKDEIKNYASNKNINISKELSGTITLFRKKWGHLGYIYAGNDNADLFSIKHYLNELVDIEKSKESVDEKLSKEQNQLEKAKLKQNKFYKEKNTPKLYRNLFQAAKNFALSKLIRRDAQLYTLYQLHHTLLEEIAKRLNISRNQVQFMLKKEIYDVLVKDKKLEKGILKKRLESCVYLVNKKMESVFVGERASELKSEIKDEVDFHGEEFTGQIAQPGYAKGIVKIIIRAKDMHKMNDGDILVSIATDPDIVVAMKKAAAIVTDQGGITSHAAIVSREMGTPCIIGTKIGSKVLKDGMLVEVDANKGTIKILKEVK